MYIIDLYWACETKQSTIFVLNLCSMLKEHKDRKIV